MSFESEEDYKALMKKMALIARTLLGLPLEEYIRNTEQSLVLSPFVDPTLWMKAHKSANNWLQCAKALRRSQIELEALREAFLEELLKDIPK